jgi:hypothetical protein
MPAGNSAVVSFPNVGNEYQEQPLSDYTSLTSSFSEDMGATKATTAWAAYDLWFNNWNNEVMIQVDFANNAPCGDTRATFGGSNGVPVQTWDFCHYGSELIWKLGANGERSEQAGSVDILAMVTWLEDHGYMRSDSKITGLSFGWEICSTGGVTEKFQMNSFAIRGTYKNGSGSNVNSSPVSAAPASTGTTPRAAVSRGGGVTVDSSGPSSSGAAVSNATSLSWSQTVSGRDSALLVGVAAGKNPDSGLSATARFDGVPMSLLGHVHDNAQSDGFLDVFGLVRPPIGTHAVKVSIKGGTPNELTGGSMSFDRALRGSAFGSVVSAFGNGSTPSLTTKSAPCSLLAGFVASGSAIQSVKTPATSRYLDNLDDNSGAGNSGAATSPGTGSKVAMAWSAASDYWGAIAVEVLPSAAAVARGCAA